MLLYLAEGLHEETKIRKLGFKLGVEKCTVDAELTNQKENTMAAYRILSSWFDSQENSKVAFSVLRKSLLDVQLKMLVQKVLDRPR